MSKFSDVLKADGYDVETCGYTVHTLGSVTFVSGMSGTEFTNRYGCDDTVTYVKIPSAVIRVTPAVFANYRNLRHVVFPPRLVVIDKAAFAHCSLLECIFLPDSVKTVESVAFHCCRSLKTVSFPKSANIDEMIFGTCTGLECVYERHCTATYEPLFYTVAHASFEKPIYRINTNGVAVFESFMIDSLKLCENNDVDDSISITTDHVYPFLTI